MLTVTVGFDASGSSKTLSPLASRYSVMPSTDGPWVTPFGNASAAARLAANDNTPINKPVIRNEVELCFRLWSMFFPIDEGCSNFRYKLLGVLHQSHLIMGATRCLLIEYMQAKPAVRIVASIAGRPSTNPSIDNSNHSHLHLSLYRTLSAALLL